MITDNQGRNGTKGTEPPDKLATASQEIQEAVRALVAGSTKSGGRQKVQVCLQCVQVVLGVIGIALMVVTLVLTARSTRQALESTGRRIGSEVEGLKEGIGQVAEGLKLTQFKITSPADGEKVEQSVTVRGVSPFPGRKHYVVVASPDRGPQVQSALVVVSSTGTWTGQAMLGQAQVGIGKDFTIQCLATESKLEPIELTSENTPNDAVFSDPVTVTRVK